MVIYFTGTGNSRFAAEKIAESLGDTLINAADYIRENKKAVFGESGPYIFVAPVYVSAPPVPFMEFIRNAEFPHNSAAYFVLTAAGSMSVSPVFCRKLAAEKHFSYKGTAELIMPQNYIAYFKMGTKDVNQKKMEGSIEKIDEIVDMIKAGDSIPEKKTKKWEYASVMMVFKAYYRFFISAKKFYVTDKCIECGKCEQLCPLGNISLREGRPVWHSNCTHCMGCINLCPTDAIEFGKKTKGKLRYHGPESVMPE